MRLTRRGGAVLAAAVLAVVFGVMYGARALNAIATPAIVALVAAVGQVWLADPPSVTRQKIVPGFPGETRAIRLQVESNGITTVTDTIDSGLVPAVDRDETTSSAGGGQIAQASAGGEQTAQASADGGQAVIELAGSDTVEYTLELRERGEHDLGPVKVAVRDVLGLVVREFEVDEVVTVLVYPRVEPVYGQGAFAGLLERAGTPEREAFDRLREYTHDDSLRDIDWKTSAKRTDGEFVVTEYAGPDQGVLTLVAESAPGYDDEMASAAASVALHLLEARLDIEVVLPTGRIEASPGTHHRERLLAAFARTGSGRVDERERERADVSVTADVQGTFLRVDGREMPFEVLREDDPTPGEVVAS